MSKSDERGRDPDRRQGGGREPVEAEASRAVRATLDRWPGPEDTSDPRELAAALLAFFTLAMLGAEVRHDGDRVSLSLRLPWGSPAGSPAGSRSGSPSGADSLAALEERVVASARRATEEVAARMHEVHGLQLADWNRREEAQRRQLAAAVGRALQREWRALASRLDALGHGAAREDLRTREALAGLVSYIVENEER